MSYVIQIEWLGGSTGPSEPSEHAGRYVSRYDVNAHEGRGQVWTHANPAKAVQFASPSKAVEFYRRVSTVKPKRPDGQPNRPLTAFTVSISKWENGQIQRPHTGREPEYV
jgi:hypothetical protein